MNKTSVVAYFKKCISGENKIELYWRPFLNIIKKIIYLKKSITLRNSSRQDVQKKQKYLKLMVASIFWLEI